nr:DUF1010 domain-containing protein [Klebsiella pneumoniae]
MFIQTAFSFSGVIQCLFAFFRASPAWAAQVSRLFASSPCVASASSYRFCSAVPPRWRKRFGIAF